MLRSKTVLFYIFLVVKASLSMPILREDNAYQLTVTDPNAGPTSKPIQDPSLSQPLGNFSEPLQDTALPSSNSSESSTFSSYLYQYRWWGLLIGPIVLVTAVYSVPALLGFTAAGIGAGTAAAGMMSAAAVSSGGAIAAGSTVAVLQSVGVLGVSSLGISLTAGLATAGGLAGYGLGYAMEKVVDPVTKFSKSAFNDTKIFVEKYAIIITNGTVEAWNSVADWAKNVDIDNIFVQFKNGSIDTWKSFKLLTADENINSAVFEFKNGTVEAWNSFTNWTKDAKIEIDSAMVEVKNGTVDAWNSVANWAKGVDVKSIYEQAKNGTIDAWNSVANFIGGSKSGVSQLTPNLVIIILVTVLFQIRAGLT